MGRRKITAYKSTGGRSLLKKPRKPATEVESTAGPLTRARRKLNLKKEIRRALALDSHLHTHDILSSFY
jgi:hypothetical protein